MLEDNISSSPSKGKSSIQSARLRRLRHKERQQNTPQNDLKKGKLRMPTLDDLYCEESDSEDHISKPIAPIKLQYGVNFDPFEDELLLAAADRSDSAQIQRSSQFQKISAEQGFLKCSQILQNTNDPPKEKTCDTDQDTKYNVAVEVSSHIVHTPCMKRNKSVVESILEDFCSSPVSPDDKCSVHSTYGSTPSEPVHDLTPVFRFKNKPIRTYSRCRKGTLTNISKRLECAVISPVDNDDDFSNCSSELSIQEDLTQSNFESPSDANLNNSVKVCENLHNLSVYFSQFSKEASEINSSQEVFDPAEGASEDLNIMDSVVRIPVTLTKLIDEIITLREKYKIVLDSDNSIDFFGFTPKEEELLLESNLECNNDVNKTKQSIESISDNNNVICKFLLSEDELFNGSDDEWDDECEFFKNFKTQNILKNPSIDLLSDMALNSNEDRKVHDIQTKNDIEIFSESAKVQNTENIDADLANIQFSEWFIEENSIEDVKKTFEEANNKSDNFGVSNKFDSYDVCNGLEILGFQTASRKSIEISEKAKAKATNFLKSVSEVDTLLKDVINLSSNEHADEPEQVGFQTASKKPILISDEARVKAANFLKSVSGADDFLKDVTDLPNVTRADSPELVGFHTASKKAIQVSDAARTKANNILKSISGVNALLNDVIGLPNADEPEQVGFQTASKKPIQISDEARVKAANFLKSVSGADDFLKDVTDLPNVTRADSPELVGFHTASKKAIQISDAARTKANNILKSVSGVDALLKDVVDLQNSSEFKKEKTLVSNSLSKSKLKDILDIELKDIQLSEWPLDEEPEMVSVSIKRHGENDASQHEPVSKWLCKSNSGNNSQRTQLTPLKDISPIARMETISYHSPLTSIKNSTVISRKNLLSLSKRKKGRLAETNKRFKTNCEQNCEATPIKMPNVLQTPSTPNLKEFFASVPNSSTPRPPRKDNLNEADTDLQQLKSEECNDDSFSTSKHHSNARSFTKLSNDSCDNISFSIANPSPKQRIERLRMYGEPQPISPAVISLNNNCRPSGLRRGRSMNKRPPDYST